MARDQAKLCLGYYPAPAEAVAHVAQFLRAPAGQPFTMLDPCAGEGLALKQLADTLGCEPKLVHGIELDEGRAVELRQRLPEAQILGPADIEGCRAQKEGFGFIWLNPPFDHAYDGGRLEGKFLDVASKWLMPGGVLALVLPEKELDNWSVDNQLKKWFVNWTKVRFPEHVRNFGEAVLLAVRRKEEANHYAYYGKEKELQAEPGFIYNIPAYTNRRLPYFVKAKPTEEEFEKAVRSSPLRLRWQSAQSNKTPSPPLALSLGHVALLLASGHLDGVVRPPRKQPHVVRGTARKTERVVSCETTENTDGSTTTKTVKTEEIELIVRTVGLDGVVRTFANEKPKEGANGTP